MNKEEIMKEIEHIANCELHDTISVKYIKDNIEKIFEENKQLKERINKAIELLILKQNSFGGIRNVSDAIEILKGSDN